ncbi:hypothetical protein P3T17_007474 [Paraburkholderia sp. GAS82]
MREEGSRPKAELVLSGLECSATSFTFVCNTYREVALTGNVSRPLPLSWFQSRRTWHKRAENRIQFNLTADDFIGVIFEINPVFVESIEHAYP